MQPRTLIEIIRRRRMASPDSTAYVFLENGETQATAVTYREVDDAAQNVAVALAKVQARGQRVVILCPQDHTYVAAFLGCVYAGAVAVPLWAPTARSDFSKLQAADGELA
jgi:acyl-CoA synthetase (AMP-forming)/AMP-acid ligase II